MNVYDRIKLRRKEIGMTQDELAKKVGYSQKAMISQIEHGKVNLPTTQLKAIADALHTTPSELMGEDGIVDYKLDGADILLEFYRGMSIPNRKALIKYAEYLKNENH